MKTPRPEASPFVCRDSGIFGLSNDNDNEDIEGSKPPSHPFALALMMAPVVVALALSSLSIIPTSFSPDNTILVCQRRQDDIANAGHLNDDTFKTITNFLFDDNWNISVSMTFTATESIPSMMAFNIENSKGMAKTRRANRETGDK